MSRAIFLCCSKAASALDTVCAERYDEIPTPTTAPTMPKLRASPAWPASWRCLAIPRSTQGLNGILTACKGMELSFFGSLFLKRLFVFRLCDFSLFQK